MDRWIELGRLYRRLLGTSPDFRTALGGLQSGGSPEFRRLLDSGTDWSTLADGLEANRRHVLGWFEDIRECDLGRGVDIVYVDLGSSPRTLEVSAWRWADRIMLIDEGLIEPDSVRTVSSPGRVHQFALPHARDGEFVSRAAWLLFCSFVPLEAYAEADLRAKWGVERELAVLFGCGDFVFHGGFVTPMGWRRPLKVVEAPGHH